MRPHFSAAHFVDVISSSIHHFPVEPALPGRHIRSHGTLHFSHPLCVYVCVRVCALRKRRARCTFLENAPKFSTEWSQPSKLSPLLYQSHMEAEKEHTHTFALCQIAEETLAQARPTFALFREMNKTDLHCSILLCCRLRA